ncbi:MAG: hypothetical protein ABSG25_03190, partial [Bryobacteraceae bacterium]
AVQRGMALLAAARDAMGGAAVGKVKAYTGIGSITMVYEQGNFSMKIEQTTDLSWRMLQKLRTPAGFEMQNGYDGKTLWAKTAQGSSATATEDENAEIEGNFFRESLWILQTFDSGKLTVQALDDPGEKLDVVAVSDPARNLLVKIFIDPQTHLIVKKDFVGAETGPSEEIYSDYREVAGVKVPFRTVVTQEGQKKLEQVWSEVKVNPGLDDSAYRKP